MFGALGDWELFFTETDVKVVSSESEQFGSTDLEFPGSGSIATTFRTVKFQDVVASVESD